MNFDRHAFLSSSDSTLLAQCQQDFFIGSGAGGQHRNKTQSGVRLTHVPTQCMVTDCAERHREMNRKNAIRKMKMAVAFVVREEPSKWEWIHTPSLKSELYSLFVAQILDFLTQYEYKLKNASEKMTISTAQLSKFILRDPQLMQKVNFERQKRALPSLIMH